MHNVVYPVNYSYCCFMRRYNNIKEYIMSNRARGIGSKKYSSDWCKEVNVNGRIVYRKKGKPASREALAQYHNIGDEIHTEVPSGYDPSGYTKHSNIPDIDNLLISDEKKTELKEGNKIIRDELYDHINNSVDIDPYVAQDLKQALEENPDHPFQSIDEYDYEKTIVDRYHNTMISGYGPPLEATSVTEVFEDHPFKKTRTVFTVKNPKMVSKKYPAIRHVADTYDIDGTTLTSTRRYDKEGNVIEVRWESYDKESNMEVNIYEDDKYQYDDGLQSSYYKIETNTYPPIDDDPEYLAEYNKNIDRGNKQKLKLRSIMNTIEQIRRFDDYDQELPM